MLDTALLLAVRAHSGQVDKCGEPYILHLLRVMIGLGPSASEEDRCVAVLHDILEDTRVTLTELEDAKFPDDVVLAVDLLTRNGEPYRQYLERLAKDPMARRVKLCDLRDNLDPQRIAKLPARYADLSARYRDALMMLLRSEED